MPRIIKVKDCPICKSHRTGYKVYVLFENEVSKERAAGYLRGELVYPIVHSSFDSEELNCICFDCGTEWKEALKREKVTKLDIENIKSEKGITKNSSEEERKRKRYEDENASIIKKERKRKIRAEKFKKLIRPIL